MSRTFHILLPLCFFGAAAPVGAAITGPIVQSASWTLEMSPIELVGEVRIEKGVRLGVEAGTLVRFASGASLMVFGSFDVAGARQAPVRFVSPQSGEEAAKIEVEGREASANFVHSDFLGVSVTVRDGARGILEECRHSGAAPAVRLEGAKRATLSRCRFSDPGTAVRSVDSSPQIEGCVFEGGTDRFVILSGVGTEYAPPASLKIRGPNRMVATKTLTLRVEALDSRGGLFWPMWKGFGSVHARRADTGAPVALSEDRIEFTNGVACTTFSLHEIGEIDIEISIDGLSSVHRVESFDLAENRTFAIGVLPQGDQVWRPEGGAYHLTGRVVVPVGSRLILEPGTLLMLDPRVEIEVYGQIEVRGTEEDPVFFFPTDRLRPWDQLRIRNTQDFFTIRHAYFTGGGDGPKETAEEHTFDGPMLRFRPHDDVAQIQGARVEGCTFSDAFGKGIFSHNGGRYEVRDCLFTRLEFGLEMHGDEVVIENCQVVQMNRGGEKQDGMYLWRPTQRHTIDGCIVTETGDDGIDAFESAVTIRNSLVYGAKDKNITLFASSGSVENCLIFGAGYGCFVREEPWEDDFEAVGCTILDHTVVGVRVENLVRASLTESILAGNFASLIWLGGAPTVSHCAFDSLPAQHVGNGNLEDDPDFIDREANDFRLRPDSPLATAGAGGGPIGWTGFPKPGAHPPVLRPKIADCRFFGVGGTAIEVGGHGGLDLIRTLIEGFETALHLTGDSSVQADRISVADCGVVFRTVDSSVNCRNAVLWENHAVSESVGSTVEFDHSTVGPTPLTTSRGPGYLSEDPLFFGRERGDYRLRSESTSAGSGLEGVDRGALPALSGEERALLFLR